MDENLQVRTGEHDGKNHKPHTNVKKNNKKRGGIEISEKPQSREIEHTTKCRATTAKCHSPVAAPRERGKMHTAHVQNMVKYTKMVLTQK